MKAFLFVCHPTGYGKSLCFALVLREVKGSIVVCISPLAALMMEQKTKYTHQGLVSEFSGELQHDIHLQRKGENSTANNT